MQILYRYIFRRALAASLIVVTTCCVIASLINLFDILDDVVKQNVTVGLLVRYLLTNLIPRMTDLLPVMMILAGIMTMGELNRRLELSSMRAAGLRDRQLMTPVAVLGVVVMSVGVFAQMDSIPTLLHDAVLLKNQLKHGETQKLLPDGFFVRIQSMSMQAAKISPETGEVEDVRLMRMTPGGEHISELYQTAKIVRAGADWKMISGMFRKFDPATGQVILYAPFEERPYPSDYPPPDRFRSEASRRQDSVEWMTISELISARSFLSRQEIHKRVAVAMSLGIGLAFGAWIGMKMPRFNMARAICLTILIGFVHRLILDGCLAVGVEMGASWVCHLANVVLAGGAVSVPFLTTT